LLVIWTETESVLETIVDVMPKYMVVTGLELVKTG